jgi:hypothetical protein
MTFIGSIDTRSAAVLSEARPGGLCESANTAPLSAAKVLEAFDIPAPQRGLSTIWTTFSEGTATPFVRAGW